MTGTKLKHIFAPVPARAVTDERLSSLDLRVLIAIAGHDRFTANGLGCTASQKRLAQLTGCHSKSLPRTISRLQEYGYINVLPMGRSRRILVVYAPTDALIWNQKTELGGNETVTTPVETKSNDSVPIGNGVATVVDAIGNRPKAVSEQNQSVTNDNILVETLLNKLGEASNKSREASLGSQLSNSPLVRASNG